MRGKPSQRANAHRCAAEMDAVHEKRSHAARITCLTTLNCDHIMRSNIDRSGNGAPSDRRQGPHESWCPGLRHPAPDRQGVNGMSRANVAAAMSALRGRCAGFFRRQHRAFVRSWRPLLDWFVREARLCLRAHLSAKCSLMSPGRRRCRWMVLLQDNCNLLTR